MLQEFTGCKLPSYVTCLIAKPNYTLFSKATMTTPEVILTLIPVLLIKASILEVLLNVSELHVLIWVQNTGVVAVLFGISVNQYVHGAFP
jgi:hypothetical protein